MQKLFKMFLVLLKQQDVVLPILHGAFGEDGTIQGLFELAGVPYVGCRVLASAVSMDKIYTKKILETAGIPQVKSLYVKKRYDGKLVVVNKQFDEIEDIEKTVEEELGFPCFIKASRSGSSVGCYRCDHKEDLMTKLIEASKYDRHIVVEECVDCIELETAVLGMMIQSFHVLDKSCLMVNSILLNLNMKMKKVKHVFLL